ncbi:prolyl-tRNA editing enzyme YbaK/EbsC (Cys-tRNA(Pro) deacylase)/ubiquinone/menaquinone biosynthesis C-methylase UbiE [Bradyrhizobium yuanmingense]|uniref:YbaK/EbsC family protein n=1 Tax=Bradyrhizobium yuanmingense TaxID=108015 RepID=UPI003514B5DF
MATRSNSAREINLNAIKAELIYENVIKRLDLEQISRFFRKMPTHFKGARVAYNAREGIIISFKTLKERYPEDYVSSFYRILVLFKIHRQNIFSDQNLRALLGDFEHLKQQENIAQFVVFAEGVREVSSQAISLLKSHDVHVVFLDGRTLGQGHVLSSFVFDNKLTEVHNLQVNLVCDEIVKRLKKLFHTVLSDIAAPVYDKLYGSTKFATELAMRKEEGLVDQIMSDLDLERRQSTQQLIAVDVGTGTGRHAFRISKYFSRVYAFDFSTHMIRVAKEKKVACDDRRIAFSVADFEYEEVDGESDFAGKVDFVCASFGMGSFVEDTPRMLRRFHEWLKPGGAVLLSFYNSNTIVESMKPNWRDTSLAAHIDADRQTAQVALEDMTFYIFCKPYQPQMKEQISGLFEIRSMISYPCITAILPNSMFDLKNAKDYFSHLDELLIRDDSYFYGHYVLVYAVKRADASGYERVRSFLASRQIACETLRHAAVFRIRDVRRVLNLKDGQMAKTVIFSVGKQKQDGMPRVAIAVVPGDKEVAKEEIARELGMSKNLVNLATHEQIKTMGFVLGAVSPFGFEQHNANYFIDEAFEESSEDYVYMGSGDNFQTLKLRKSDFLELTKTYTRLRAQRLRSQD